MPSEPLGFDFLGLPREIRDQVYDLVWATKKPFELALPYRTDYSRDEQFLFVFRIAYVILEPLIDIERPQIVPRRRRMWLLANKQICSEAVEQFQCVATWSCVGQVYSYAGDRRFLGVWKSPTSRRKNARLGPHLLTPHCATTIDCGHLTMATMQEVDHSEEATCLLSFVNEAPRFLQRLDSSLAMAIALRKLSLSLCVGTFSYGTCSSPTDVDFLTLHNLDLPSLQVVEIKVEYVSPVSSQGRVLFEDCLHQLCESLVGGFGVSDNRITSLDPPAAIYRYRRGVNENSSSNNRRESTALLEWLVEE